MEIARTLHPSDIREQLPLRQMQLLIAKAIVRLRREKGRIHITLLHRQQIPLRRARPHIAQIRRTRGIRLSLEHAHNRLHRIRLVRLHRKVKLHQQSPVFSYSVKQRSNCWIRMGNSSKTTSEIIFQFVPS